MGWFSRRPPESDPRNEEYSTLSAEEKRRIDAAIDEVKRTGKPASHVHGGDEVYGYPHASGGVSWGVNAPLNTKGG